MVSVSPNRKIPPNTVIVRAPTAMTGPVMDRLPALNAATSDNTARIATTPAIRDIDMPSWVIDTCDLEIHNHPNTPAMTMREESVLKNENGIGSVLIVAYFTRMLQTPNRIRAAMDASIQFIFILYNLPDSVK